MGSLRDPKSSRMLKIVSRNQARNHRVFNMELTENNPCDCFTDLNNKLKGTSLYFVGMMGSGKSTCGKVIANKLGYRFLDTDEVAEYMIEMPISDFFAQGKKEQFRDLEYQILMEMAQYTRVVISTGGGIVERNPNWGVMRHGLIVFLDMKPEDIFQRLSADQAQIAKRPLLQGENPLQTLIDLSQERRDKYLLADVHCTLDPVMNADQVAEKVVNDVLQFIKQNPPLWETWKKQRENVAVEAAGRYNPQAVAKAGVGFGVESDRQGDVTFADVADLENGKTKIPHIKPSKQEG